MLLKTQWFLDKKSPIILGIDDITNAIYQTSSREMGDCGFYGLSEIGIYRYFENYILKKYPEIKVTYFLVFDKHSIYIESKGAYSIYETEKFKNLLFHIINRGDEISYHGHNHGHKNATVENKKWCREFEQYSKQEYFEIIYNDIERFKNEFGYDILGGRTPCYQFEDSLIDGLISVGFKWWSFDHKPFINNIGMCYKGYDIIEMPSNLHGGIFNYCGNYLKYSIKKYLNLAKIEKMIDNHEVISIAEHFMNARPDGKRQTPNVYDDINSLDFLFGYLRNKDVWYATFSECANYYESYNNTEIISLSNNTFDIKYKGNWKMFLTFASDSRYLENVETKERFEGQMKNGKWLFNNLVVGTYREIA